MILESLTLENVGPYAGEQVITFAPPSDTKPVTLIGGLNGAGKTTVMRSLFHVLYGQLAMPLIGRKGAYDNYLREQVNRASENARIALRIRLVLENGHAEVIDVERSWSRGEGKIRENLRVARAGTEDRELTDTWSSFIEERLPRSIARLFFFDGEQVEALADLEAAGPVLDDALGALLGLDLVERLIADLAVVERRKVEVGADSDGKARLAQLAEEREAASELLKEAHAELDEALALKRDASNRRTIAKEAYQASGGDAFDEREALALEAERAAERLATLHAAARELAASPPAPLMLIADEANGLLASALDASAARFDDQLAKILEQRDSAVVAFLSGLGLADALGRQLEDYLSSDRQARSEAAAQADQVQVLAPLSARASEWREALAAAKQAARALQAQIEAATFESEECSSALERIPTVDSIRTVERELADAELDLDGALSKVDDHVALVERRERSFERATLEEQREAKRVAELEVRELTAKRVLKHSQRARQTLAAMREDAVKRHIGRIEEFATESIQHMLHKEQLVERIRVDPSSFAVSVLAKTASPGNGKAEPIDPAQLSAGERQLTALALMWALAKASNRIVPVVVDTPLGRLDYSHREHVVERYIPFASEQVVVLSTDTEITGALYQKLAPHIGAEFLLDVDEVTGDTVIVEGYLAHPTPA